MIRCIDIKIQAAVPDIPLQPFISYVDSPSSVRVLDVPKRIGSWTINKVYVQATYPDGDVYSKECVRTGNVWVGTLPGPQTPGSSEKGFVVAADGTDEDGNPVTGYVLGVGDVRIMDIAGGLTPETHARILRLFDQLPENPKKGDAYLVDNVLKVYDGTQWKDVGGVNLDDYIKIGDNFLRKDGRQTPILLWDSNPENPSKDTTQHMELRGDGISMHSFNNRNHAGVTPSSLYLDDDETESSQQPVLQVGTFKGLFTLGDYVEIFQYGDQKWAKLDGHNILTDGDVEPDRSKQGYALYSSNADYATTAGDASYASAAGTAYNADEATKATQDGSGNVITSTYATKQELQDAIGEVLTEDF